MPGWIARTLAETSLDLAQADGYSVETTETLLEEFDENVGAARAAIEASKDEHARRARPLRLRADGGRAVPG